MGNWKVGEGRLGLVWMRMMVFVGLYGDGVLLLYEVVGCVWRLEKGCEWGLMGVKGFVIGWDVEIFVVVKVERIGDWGFIYDWIFLLLGWIGFCGFFWDFELVYDGMRDVEWGGSVIGLGKGE